METRQQNVIRGFIELLADTATTLLGPKEVSTLVPEVTVHPGISRFWLGRIETHLDLNNRPLLEERAQKIIGRLEQAFGHTITENWLEELYTKLERQYSPALANELVLPLIPKEYLEKYRLRIFSREELATMLEHERERDRELAAANAELRELDRRKSEFISVVAHQLRTPLGGLKWALNLLAKGQAGAVTPEAKDILEKSYDENEHMISLVEEMLHADKIEAGQFAISPQSTDLVALIENVVKDFTVTAAKKQIVLSFTKPTEKIPLLLLDGLKMRSVFQNIIENAIQYSPTGSTVTICIQKEEHAVTVSVADHGIGIPKAADAQVFSRLFRAENARHAEPNGNGLGLYIAKGIVALHGGTIRYESEEHRGTTFFITLPV